MREGVGVTTAFSNKRSIVLFVIALVLVFGLLFVFKTYRELSSETITVETEDDVLKAKNTIAENVEGLKRDVTDLEALVAS